MSQAFYSAMSGMNAAQTKVNVVADNIANMNTVGFKQSSVQFSDIYYNTMSAGGAPSTTMGGTNPRQVGTGVRVGAIARDFSGGTAVTTGISTHLSVKGSGFFTVLSPSNEVLYTRAGNFTVDGNGNMVLPNGYKALGTDSGLSTAAGSTPIKIPPLIQTETTPSPNAGNKNINDLNGNVNFTAGDIDVVVNGVVTKVNIASTDTLAQVAGKINTAMNGVVNATITDGKLTVDIAVANQNDEIVFNNGTSNFVTESKLTRNDATGVFDSKVLDYHQSVNVGTDAASSQKATNVDIYDNGIVEVTYANGDKLSVMPDPNNPNSTVFKYKTGNPAVTITGNDLEIPAGVAVPANFQLQMASFVNPNGLNAVGGNAYKEGPNSGLAMFGNISSGAFGTVNSGEYEGSNVDLAEQFADMVVAQRMLEANSRVFDTSSQIMKTLTYLGQ